jgi:hypothetical protein
MEWEGMDWINSAQDRDRWQAAVNTVMNLQIPWGICGLAEGVLDSQGLPIL